MAIFIRYKIVFCWNENKIIEFSAPYNPIGNVEVLYPGTWYVTEIDGMHRRKYDRKPADDESLIVPTPVQNSVSEVSYWCSYVVFIVTGNIVTRYSTCLTMLSNAEHCFTMLHKSPQCLTILHNAWNCSTMLHNTQQCLTMLHNASQSFTMFKIAQQCLAMQAMLKLCRSVFKTQGLCRISILLSLWHGAFCISYKTPIFQTIPKKSKQFEPEHLLKINL